MVKKNFYIEIENKRFELEKEDEISQKEKKVKISSDPISSVYTGINNIMITINFKSGIESSELKFIDEWEKNMDKHDVTKLIFDNDLKLISKKIYKNCYCEFIDNSKILLFSEAIIDLH